jgi:hypothetical protein
MQDRPPLFTAPTEANDKASAKDDFILPRFGWLALEHAIETSVPTLQS